MDEVAYNTMKYFKGDKLIFIGEGFHFKGDEEHIKTEDFVIGVNAESYFFRMLSNEWKLIKEIGIPHYTWEKIFLYGRKK
jgi:hypothetical protein